MPGIFISHTHADKPVADAVAALVQDLFGSTIAVSYSSKKELLGGIGPGADWADWIAKQVLEADIAFVMLTPGSIQKPWLLWEAGAVEGADRARAERGDSQRVWPLTYGLSSTDIPSPFASKQAIDGARNADINVLIDALFQRLGAHFTPAEVRRFGFNQQAAVSRYLAVINTLLPKLPLRVTEDAVQEWLLRLDELRAQARFSEVAVLENWLDVSFGREEDDRARPIDIRLHTRMGDLYQRSDRPADAARQFELARKMAPRDIFVLRRLGKARLDAKDLSGAQNILSAIEVLDGKAFERNVENAALKARWIEACGDFTGARQTLEIALRMNSGNYYLSDLIGQNLLRSGKLAEAKQVYQQVLQNLAALGEDNIWTNATALTAAIVLDRDEDVQVLVKKILDLRPTREQLTTIRRGLDVIIISLGKSAGFLDRLAPARATVTT